MAKSDTWMAIYWGDYWKDTGHLSAAEHGAYLNLIGAYWVSGKPLPADDTRLARLAKTANEKEWQRLKPAVTEFFQKDGNTYRHARIEKELQKAQAHSEAKAKAGLKGSQKRWQKHSRTIAEPSVSHKQTARQTDAPSPSPSITSLRDGADAPLAEDLKSKIFGPALTWLAEKSQTDAKKLRSMVGRWCSQYGDGATLQAFASAAKHAPLDPVPFIEKVLKNGRRKTQSATDTASEHLEALASLTGFGRMADRGTSAGEPDAGEVIDGDFSVDGSPETLDGRAIPQRDGAADSVRGSVRDTHGQRENGSGSLPRNAVSLAERLAGTSYGADSTGMVMGQQAPDASGNHADNRGRTIPAQGAINAGADGDETLAIPDFLKRTA